MAIRQLKSGDVVPPTPPRRYVAGHGYVRLRWKVGKGEYVEVYEHRVVDGRVTDAEQVHHQNHKRHDNRPENLEHLSATEHFRRHGSSLADRAIPLYKAGWGTPRIAQELGCNGSAVYRLLQRRGLIEQRAYAPPLPSDSQLREWHSAGVRAAEMTRRADVDRKRIDRRLDELGLPRFRPGRLNITENPKDAEAEGWASSRKGDAA